MCLAVPMEIKEIQGKEALAEALGISRKIRLDFIREPEIGDYVMVHAGFAIEKIARDQALEDTAAWKELQDALV